MELGQDLQILPPAVAALRWNPFAAAEQPPDQSWCWGCLYPPTHRSRNMTDKVNLTCRDFIVFLKTHVLAKSLLLDLQYLLQLVALPKCLVKNFVHDQNTQWIAFCQALRRFPALISKTNLFQSSLASSLVSRYSQDFPSIVYEAETKADVLSRFLYPEGSSDLKWPLWASSTFLPEELNKKGWERTGRNYIRPRIRKDRQEISRN